MINEVSGSIRDECNARLTNLYNQHHQWLMKCSYNICKSKVEAEELCSDLYLYLSKECREKIWYADSYNLFYCQKFLSHRWLNRAPKRNRYNWTGIDLGFDIEDKDYDIERDIKVMRVYEGVMQELKNLQTTKLWPQARLYELYWMSDDTLNEVAKKIGISKSTTFLAIKKIRNYLKDKLENPFE